MIETGRKITNDCTSMRDAPPVKNSSAIKATRAQNIGEGLLSEARTFDKTVIIQEARLWRVAIQLSCTSDFGKGRATSKLATLASLASDKRGGTSIFFKLARIVGSDRHLSTNFLVLKI